MVGEHRATLDPEGRILLPMALRNLLNPSREDRPLMATLEPEGCISLRAEEVWDAYVEGFRGAEGEGLRRRRVVTLLAANSARVKCDRQGRVRVPDVLLAKASIERGSAEKREVVVVGDLEDVQIWHPERWDGFERTAKSSFGEDVDHLLGNRPGGAEEGEPA